MKMHEANDENSIRALLDYLNVCHDGVVRRVSFIKDRDYTIEGDVYYPRGGVAPGESIDAAECDVEMELLLNSYDAASLRQVVLLYFERVRSFRFYQEPSFDYAEILEVDFRVSEPRGFEFIFRIGPEKKPTDVLSLTCETALCFELER